jgi:hypothetical protein
MRWRDQEDVTGKNGRHDTQRVNGNPTLFGSILTAA